MDNNHQRLQTSLGQEILEHSVTHLPNFHCGAMKGFAGSQARPVLTAILGRRWHATATQLQFLIESLSVTQCCNRTAGFLPALTKAVAKPTKNVNIAANNSLERTACNRKAELSQYAADCLGKPGHSKHKSDKAITEKYHYGAPTSGASV